MRHKIDTNLRYPELWRGCVGAWAPCLGPTGLTLRDWSGYGNHGQLLNGSQFALNGNRHAVAFDATNDVVRATARVPVYPFSFGCWFLAKTLHTGRLVFYGASTTNFANFSLATLSGGQIRHTAEFDTGGGQVIDGGSYSADRWHHVWVNLYSSTHRQLFFDGRSVGTSVVTVDVSTTIDRFSLGWTDRPSPVVPFDGFIDDARLYTRSPTTTEISLLATRRGIAYETTRNRSRVFLGGFRPYWIPRRSQIIGGGM